MRVACLLLLLICGTSAVSQSRTETSSCSCHTRARKGFTDPVCKCTARPHQNDVVNSLVGFFGMTAELATHNREEPTECHCTSDPQPGFTNDGCECGATQVACPENSSGHPNCKPNEGYFGVITWNAETEKYQIINDETDTHVETVPVRDCPENAENWKTCSCVSGYKGSFSWNSTLLNWDGRCSLVDCPLHGGTGPECACTTGYRETVKVEFDENSQDWTGTCEKVLCPVNSLSGSHPQCTCKTGFSGAVSFNDDTDAFHDGCTLALCPGNSTHIGDGGVNTALCECIKGYYDADSDPLAFTDRGWTGSCEVRPCPDNSENHPECICSVGYLGGILVWETKNSTYTSKCARAVCPSGGIGDKCACADGFVSNPPEPAWDAVNGWQHTCTAPNPPCPMGSSITNPSACVCNLDGYTGSLEWEGTTWGECKEIPCPVGGKRTRLGDGKFVCACDIGYEGLVTWNNNQWNGGCSEVVCPTNARCNPPEASCVQGWSHTVEWNSEETRWDSTCSEVQCPDGSTGHPDCQCNSGYAGGNATNHLQWVYNGQDSHYECTGDDCKEPCRKIDCPENSQRNKDQTCSCLLGFAGGIHWNLAKKEYVGSCEPQPCPHNSSVSAGADCTCQKGFLPSEDYGFTNNQWQGNCIQQSCGQHTTNWPECTCKSGAHYTNNIPISWSATNGYSGSCAVASCPTFAADSGTTESSCKCPKGYATMYDGGIITANHVWNKEEGVWDHSCHKVDCNVGADKSQHPNCECMSGYSGNTVWSSTEGRWSACTEVPCDEGANLVRASSSEDTAQCNCKVGYFGNVIWNATVQDWTGECVKASCPKRAVCGETQAACAKGYTGTVTWESPQWIADCATVHCPVNSGPHPDCTCSTGYAGGELTFDGTNYANCTYIKCPPNSDRLESGNCMCKEFFNGTISWDTNEYLGKCALAPCPAYGGKAPDCACEYGTKPSNNFGWFNATQQWTGVCTPAKCPPNAKSETQNCTCAIGYAGTVSWDADQSTFTGECIESACPDHANGEGCPCNSGYTGTPAFNGTHWLHVCTPEACAADSTRIDLDEGGYTCKCNVPFSGAPKWTGTYWTAECEEVQCPTFSSMKMGDPSICICRDGFHGDIRWQPATQSYDSICVPVNCPANSVADQAAGTCVCKAGYTGDVVWGTDDWDSKCAQGDCPSNSEFSTKEDKCICNVGFKGKLNWDEHIDDYVGKCTKVVCAEAVEHSIGKPHPECACESGYKETTAIEWDNTEQTYKGVCEIEDCPSFAAGHPKCHCMNAYRNLENDHVRWNDETDKWDGKCEAIPCPANAGSEPPNCKCETGFAPKGLTVAGDQYVGSCEPVACPNNHGTTPDCSCAVGYQGSVTWNATSYSWSHTCTFAPCPAHATEHLICNCMKGYSGIASWNATGQEWNHTCVEVRCPSNTDSHPDCQCSSGYTGTIEWELDQEYSGTCSIVPCPALSRRRIQKRNADAAIAGCDCYVGYKGGFDWIGAQYDGACTKQTCPVDGNCDAVFERNPATSETVFSCQPGFEGSITWDNDHWVDSCTEVKCPDNSRNHPECPCNPGFKGAIRGASQFTGNPLKYLWEFQGSCSFVPCPDTNMVRTDNEAGYPECTCPAGFAGIANWQQSSQSFVGSQQCVEVQCPTLMVKQNEGKLCNCPVNYSGTANWIATSQSYESHYCVQSLCPTGAVCDHNHSSRKCQNYYTGSYEWDFEKQEWNANCAVAECPGNSKKVTDGDTPQGCICSTGFGDIVRWDQVLQSYNGCSQDAECPPNADPVVRDQNKGRLCPCKAGYRGQRLWDPEHSTYNHTCTQMECPIGTDRKENELCDCSIGWVGGLEWNYDRQTYLGGCTAAKCSGEGVDCTNANQTHLNPVPDLLPCRPGFLSRTVWTPQAGEVAGYWNNDCAWVTCPANSVRVSEGVCACRWGYQGDVAWNATNQTFDSTCTISTCDTGTHNNGDGHCVCPRATSAGTCSYGPEDAWTCECSALRSCQTNASPSGADCLCDQGYRGRLDLTYTVTPNDSNETSTVSMSTERHGNCVKIECPANSREDSFPNCSCGSGYSGSVVWDSEAASWTTNCTVAPCPSHSTNGPECKAMKGYLGYLAWNFDSQQYDGSLQLAPCPDNANSGYNSIFLPTCHCKRGYNGTQSFTPRTGWTHTCELVQCPAHSAKVTADETDYIIFQGFVGCHSADNETNYGYIDRASNVLGTAQEDCSSSNCILRGNEACEKLVDAGGECWGFAVSHDWGVQLYNDDAVNKASSSCSPTNGLTPHSSWTTYKRRLLTGDCRCEPGFYGSFAWAGSKYQGACLPAACPSNADCSNTVKCHQGYSGSSEIRWDFAQEKWIGECHPVECPSNALDSSFPACHCTTGYSGLLQWDQPDEKWTGTCTKVDCPANSDANFPTCKCNRGYVRSDGAADTTILWSFESQQWRQTCKEVACPHNSLRAGDGQCICRIGHRGEPVFEFETASYEVTKSTDFNSCVKVDCPSNSHEIDPETGTVFACKCNVGYVGTVSWNPFTSEWSPCSRIDCPAHSTGHPHCSCSQGYGGSLAWTGLGFDGRCDELISVPQWGAVPKSAISGATCTTLQGSQSLAQAVDGALTFTFAQPAGEKSVVRCDIRTAYDFSKLRGSMLVEPLNESVVNNNYEVTLWNSPYSTFENSFLAFGSPYDIIDAGKEGGIAAKQYTEQASIAIAETSVTQTNKIRIEVSQHTGVSLKVTLSLESYNLPEEIVRTRRSSGG